MKGTALLNPLRLTEPIREGQLARNPINRIPPGFRSKVISLSFGLAHSIRSTKGDPFSTLIRLGGGGYQVTGRCSSTLSHSWERVRVLAAKPEKVNPLEYWLRRGTRSRDQTTTEYSWVEASDI